MTTMEIVQGNRNLEMNGIPETAYCHRCQRVTPTRLMYTETARVTLNICRVCRSTRKGRPNVPYTYYEEWARTHPLTDAEKNPVTGRERRRLEYRAEQDRLKN